MQLQRSQHNLVVVFSKPLTFFSLLPLQMLTIHFSGPLANSKTASGAIIVPSPYNKPSFGPRRSQTTFASSQQQPRQEGSNAHSHEQKMIDNQKQAYNTISESWNVPRTSLNHFPAETQRHIRENRRAEKPAASNGTSATSAAAAAAVQSSATSSLQSSITKTLQVLAYESKAGYNNFQGKSGEHFTDWMTNTLRVLSSDLTASGRGTLAQQCEVLSAQYIAGYGSLLGGASERQRAISELTAALNSLSNELRQPPITEPIPKQIDSSKSNGNVDIDAEAAEAHAEETATTTATIATATAAADGEAFPTSSTPPNPTTSTNNEAANLKGVTDLGDGYVMLNNRRVKASTVAFRQSFAQAAAMQQASSSQFSDFSNGEQRTSQWLSLRERRLTASAFSKALGFFPGDRESLWEEKVGLKAPFAGNEATSWGTRMEPEALQQYESLTGQRVESCMFRVKHDDPPHGWLGASPDGLVQGLEISNTLILPTTNNNTNGRSSLGQGPGILEIKCPYNKGHPELAVPPQRAIWYYMPQLQGLMDIFDRRWCSLYVWTQSHGSASFQVERNQEYWAAAFEILAEFWWGHVVPARQAHDAGCSMEEIESYRPVDQIEAAEKLRKWSKILAAEAPGTFYSPPNGGRHVGGGAISGPARRY
jgi:putative phage-type endonuclease